MPGTYQYDVEIKSNVAKLLSDMKQVQDRLDAVEGKEYKIKLNVDEKKLSNVISNLEKMLDSLGKGTGDFKQFENLSKELSSIVSEVQSLSKAFGKVDDSGAKTLLSSIKNIDKSLSELSQNILNVNKNMSNMGGNTSGAVKQVENISNAYQDAAKEAEKLADAQSKIGQKTNISSGMKDAFPDKDVSASVESATNSIKEENNVLEQNTQKVKENTQAKEQNANINLNKYDKRLDSYNGKVDKYQATIARFNDGGWTSSTYLENVQAVKNAVKEYETLLNELKGKDASLVTSDDISNLDKYEKKIKDAIATVTNMSAAEKGYNFVSGQKELDKIHKLLNENSKMSSEAKAKIKAYYSEIESGNPSMSLDKIHGEILKIYNAEVEAGRAGRTLWDTLKNSGFHQIAAQMAGMVGVYDVINIFRDGINTLKEFDDSLTKISYTMDMTKSQLDNLGNSVLDMASDMKSSIDDAMQVAQIYANMQTSAEEIQKLSEPTLILSNLSGFDASTVADDIQAASQQFDIAAEDSMHIADVYDYISRNIQVDYSKGLESMAEGLQVAGSTAKQAGLDLEQTTAIIAKAVEKTRLEGSQVGNGLKTILTRLSKVGELSDEVDNETLSKASESLHQIGIEVYNVDGSYRQFDVIMGELAEKWDGLTDAEKSNLSYNIAATRQTNLLSAILSNFSDSMQLAEEATNANGSAIENQQKYMESFSGHLQSLETEAKIAWLNILDSETLKDGVDLLTGLVKVVGQLVDTFGLLGTTAGIGGIVAGFKNVGIFTTKNNELAIFGQTLDDIREKLINFNDVIMQGGTFGSSKMQLIPESKMFKELSSETASEIVETLNSIKNGTNSAYDSIDQYLTYLSSNGKPYIKDYVKANQNQVYITEDVIQASKDARAAQIAQNEAVKEGTLSFKAGQVALKGLALAGNMVVGILAGFVISKAIEGLDNLVHAADNAKESAEGFASSFSSMNDEFSSNDSKLSDLQKQYDELSKGVNSLGENVSLTTDQYDEYKQVVSEISDMMPSLLARYDDEGNKIGFVQGKLSNLNAEYDKYKKNKAMDLVNGENDNGDSIKDVFDNYQYQTAHTDANGNVVGKRKMFGDSNYEKILALQSEIGSGYDGIFGQNKLTNEDIEKKTALIQKYQSEIDASVSAIQNALSAIAQSGDEYYKLSDQEQQFLDTYINSLSQDFIDENNLTNETNARTFINNLINDIESGKPEIMKAYNDLFSFNIDDTDLSPEEVQKKVNELIQQLAKALGEDNWQDLKIRLGFEFVDDNVKDYEDTINRFNDPDKIKQFFNTEGINTSDEVKQFNDLTKGINDADKAIQTWNEHKKESNETPISFTDALNSSEYADIKEKLIDLAKAGQLTPETLSSTQEYLNLLKETGTTAEQACEKIKKLATDGMDFTDWQTQLENARSTISDLQTILTNMNDNKGKLTDDDVDKIISSYPSLIAYIGNEEAMREKINELIGDQGDIAQQAASQMLEYNESAYKELLSSTDDLLKGINISVNGETNNLTKFLSKAYNTDLNNFSSLAEAKLKIESDLIGNLSEGWASFYGVQIDALTGMASITQNQDQFYANTPQAQEAQSNLAAYNEAITRLNAARDKMASASLGTLGTVTTKSKKTKSKTKSDAAEVFDFIEIKLNNLTDKASKAKDKID